MRVIWLSHFLQDNNDDNSDDNDDMDDDWAFQILLFEA